MLIEWITRENLPAYVHLLTGDELIGMENGRISCFGAIDERTWQAMGMISLQILPRHIEIKRLFTIPLYRRRGVATALLEQATDLPENEKRPFYVITEADGADTGFLISRGFTQARSKYAFLTGSLKNLQGEEGFDGKVLPIGKTSYRSLTDYVTENKPDTFLQLPEIIPDMNRFSEDSLCCVQDGRLCGTLLLEELSAGLQIALLRAEECCTGALFAELKRQMEPECGSDAVLRFLICGEGDRMLAQKSLSDSREQPIHIFKFKRRGEESWMK